MDKDGCQKSERILYITMEIIYLLTGQDYTVVKTTSGECETPISCASITEPPPHSLIHGRDNEWKILELTNKIIQLLTGEVPIRCQDVTVYFSMEEWEYIEEHKDLYKDVMMENHQLRTSLDGSSNRDSPETCPHPLYSQHCTEENHRILQEDQCEDVTDVMVKDIKAEETYVKCDQQCKEEKIPTDISTDGASNRDSPERFPRPLYSQDCTEGNHRTPQENQGGDLTIIKVENSKEEEEMSVTDNKGEYLTEIKVEPMEEEETYVRGDQQCNEEEIPTDISADGRTSMKPSEGCHILSPHFKIEDNITQNSPGEIPITLNIHPVSRSTDILSDPSNCEDCSPANSNIAARSTAHRGDRYFPCSECGKCYTRKSRLVAHQRRHISEEQFPCSECGRCFTQKSYLAIHERLHTGETPYPCSECGKCFPASSSLVKHQRSHTGVKPFSCSECGKGFTMKSRLVLHHRSHTGEKPFLCSECGKYFTQKSGLDKHHRTHTGVKPFSCPECGKCFSQTSHLVTHQKIHNKR
ncbi:oocyte zinc finger protein XlCOF8.4-like isoform X2 [Pseudophryne corroboree]|uniref:oocyte zinc finger protein XlCOF8.4-like isoform X2 n=1 Tax=Pseudophryne corroboree TaxID=495146 RepID=UPI003081CF41